MQTEGSEAPSSEPSSFAGKRVIAHGLSCEELNGLHGVCGRPAAETGRHPVLFDGHKVTYETKKK